MVLVTGTHATVLVTVTGMAFGIKALEVALSTNAVLRSFLVLHVVVAVVTIPNKRFNVPGQQCKYSFQFLAVFFLFDKRTCLLTYTVKGYTRQT